MGRTRELRVPFITLVATGCPACRCCAGSYLRSTSHRAFEEEQKLRKQEIVSRILKEEAEEEQRKRRQHPPSKHIGRWTLRDKTWKYISDFCEGKSALTSTHQQVGRKLPFQVLDSAGGRAEGSARRRAQPWPCEAHQGPLLLHVNSSYWPMVLLSPYRAACL